MKTIEVTDDVYELIQIMKENALEEVTENDVITFMIHRVSMDIEEGII